MSDYKKFLFWGSVIGLSAISLGSFYYVFNLILGDEEDENDLFDENGKLTDEGAVKLLIKINKLGEKLFQKQYAELDKERLEAFNEEEKYLQLTVETLETKTICSQFAAEEILKNLPQSVSLENLNQRLQSIAPNKLEELNARFDELEEGEELLVADKAKEAFMFYANEYLTQIKKIDEKYKNYNEGEEKKEHEMMMDIITMKTRTDDLLLLKKGVKESEVRRSIYKHHLIKDPEIMALQKELEKFDKK